MHLWNFYFLTLPFYFLLFAHAIFVRDPKPEPATSVLAWLACILFALVWPLVIVAGVCRGIYKLVRRGVTQ
jgi:hypothetical protein